MKPTEPKLWGISADTTGDADSLFSNKHYLSVGWEKTGGVAAAKPDRVGIAL